MWFGLLRQTRALPRHQFQSSLYKAVETNLLGRIGKELLPEIIAQVSRQNLAFVFVYENTWGYMTLGRCPLSIFCSRGTPP